MRVPLLKGSSRKEMYLQLPPMATGGRPQGASTVSQRKFLAISTKTGTSLP